MIITGRSLPSRERGLKLAVAILAAVIGRVAPFTGAWIETCLGSE